LKECYIGQGVGVHCVMKLGCRYDCISLVNALLYAFLTTYHYNLCNDSKKGMASSKKYHLELSQT
jgi:hypothetical protein